MGLSDLPSATSLQITVSPLDLYLRHPFGISRRTRSVQGNVLVSVTDGQIVGRGEGAPCPHRKQSQSQLLHSLGTLTPLFIDCDPSDTDPLEALQGPLSLAARALPAPALSALDLALHDWLGKRHGVSIGRLWRPPTIGSERRLSTTFTIGIAEPAVMAERAGKAAEHFGVLKIKLGTDQDRTIIDEIRRVTNVALRVDVNEGWSDERLALEHIKWLADRGVESVEQPLAAGRLQQMAWLKRNSPLPLFADEDCLKANGVAALANAYHGLNVKLDKCGGLRPARALITSARQAQLQVMVGCMVASSLAITAAAHLAPLADLADLDGHLLLADDPFSGLHVRGGQIELPDGPGLGVTRKGMAKR